MTTYVLVQDEAVGQVGAPAIWFDELRWWDFRPQDHDTYLEAGWLPLVETSRPADTETVTFDYSVEVIDEQPTEVWTERPWTEDELAGKQVAILKREQEAAMAALVPEQTDALLGATAPPAGEAWKQPTGAHDAYPLGWMVIHIGKQWESLVTANVWEPPTSWREAGNEWPDWVQPTGAHDAYDAGAKVSHLDMHWISDVDANTWEPGVFGWTG